MTNDQRLVLVDSHAHLEGKRFDSDREQVLVRARDAGVEAILAIGIGDGPGTLDCAIKLAEKQDATPDASSSNLDSISNSLGSDSPSGPTQSFKQNTTPSPSVARSGHEGALVPTAVKQPRLYATVGIHPHEAQLARDADFAELERLAKHPKVIAWGEIGLDYFYHHSPREVQKNVFTRQMEQAREAKLPIVIHCRPSENSDDAWDDCLDLIREHWVPSGLGGILHCFTGTWEHAKRGLDAGFMISFAGNITFPKAQLIRDTAKAVPLDRVLIETDSPFLAPVPNRGKRNEPAFVKDVARQLGELRGLSTEEVGLQTSRNFYRFFSLPEKPNSI